MAKYDAFGSKLRLGVRQVETALIVGTITGPGNASITLTKAGMAGSGVPFNVAVLLNDTPTTVATKIVAVMLADADITAVMDVEASGPYIIMTVLVAAANDVTMNLAYANGTCTGLVNDATSNDTTAGVALTDIAQIVSIGGPTLSVDTEDVTCHDSAGAFEEVVATVIRSGEVTLDIVYDPVAATHDGTTGLISRLTSKAKSQYRVVFPDAANTLWTMDGWTSGFEPGEPHDGALTASVTIKVTGEPTLA